MRFGDNLDEIGQELAFPALHCGIFTVLLFRFLFLRRLNGTKVSAVIIALGCVCLHM